MFLKVSFVCRQNTSKSLICRDILIARLCYGNNLPPCSRLYQDIVLPILPENIPREKIQDTLFVPYRTPCCRNRRGDLRGHFPMLAGPEGMGCSRCRGWQMSFSSQLLLYLIWDQIGDRYRTIYTSNPQAFEAQDDNWQTGRTHLHVQPRGTVRTKLSHRLGFLTDDFA